MSEKNNEVHTGSQKPKLVNHANIRKQCLNIPCQKRKCEAIISHSKRIKISNDTVEPKWQQLRSEIVAYLEGVTTECLGKHIMQYIMPYVFPKCILESCFSLSCSKCMRYFYVASDYKDRNWFRGLFFLQWKRWYCEKHAVEDADKSGWSERWVK